MDISGVSSPSYGTSVPTTRQNAPGTVRGVGDSPVVQEFTEYMKKSPAERMMDDWLRAHGMTKEEFDALGPEEKQKILEEMKQDIEEKMKEKAAEGAAPGSFIDLLS
ncbi:MAG TPA: hypothetical protein VGF14_05295 [Alphaproteobacteria bacterium]